MRLFISYASEDRADFAEPLAIKLRENYDVWFAPYELTVGDSLFQKINEGLRSCDYGVVILSHSFFAKKWPPAELNGLFALEEPSRKIILPVWRNITAEEIKEYSPILADRVAANGSQGIDAVVPELRFAIDTSDRQRALGRINPALEKLKTLASTIDEQRNSELLLASEEGVRLVSEAAGHFFDIVEKAFSEIGTSGALNATYKRTGTRMLQVICNYRLTLHLTLSKVFINTALPTIMQALIIRDKGNFIRDSEWDVLSTHDFKPFIRRGPELVWKPDDGTSRTLSAEDMLTDVLDKFRTEFERAALP